jgi:hypothetical protein
MKSSTEINSGITKPGKIKEKSSKKIAEEEGLPFSLSILSPASTLHR